jgi:hypothetical protein
VLNTPTMQPGVEYAQQVLAQFIACVRLRSLVCIRGLSLCVCVFPCYTYSGGFIILVVV